MKRMQTFLAWSLPVVVLGVLACWHFWKVAKHEIPAMPVSLKSHSMVLLPNGRVLVMGGISNPKPSTRFSLRDELSGLYNEITGGLRVFSAIRSTNKQLACEVYDPKGNRWSMTDDLKVSEQMYPETISLPALTALSDGSVLAVGTDLEGFPSMYWQGWAPAKDCERFDLEAKTWELVGQFGPAESGVTTVSLTTGEVLELGGYYGGCHNLDTSGWHPSGPNDPDYRFCPRLLNDCHLYEPASKSWVDTGSMVLPRNSPEAVLLHDGSVLVVGGASDSDKTCELYDLKTRTWRLTGSTEEVRARASLNVLPDGRVLAAGGGTATCEVYDPQAGTWRETSSLFQSRSGQQAVALANGKVLVIGGDATGTLCELFDPKTGTWSATGSLGIGRASFSAILLKDGRVFVSGGSDVANDFPGTYSLDSCELYDPATGEWTM